MVPTLISSLVGILSFVLLDYIWLAKIAKNFYLGKLATHTTILEGNLVPYLPAIPLVYIVGILGIWIFALGRAGSLGGAFLYGAILGFIMYAFYDFTNLATLKDYSWSLTLLDILWGTLLVATVTAIMFFVKDFLQ
jgi:uncharacterized membrane protein